MTFINQYQYQYQTILILSLVQWYPSLAIQIGHPEFLHLDNTALYWCLSCISVLDSFNKVAEFWEKIHSSPYFVCWQFVFSLSAYFPPRPISCRSRCRAALPNQSVGVLRQQLPSFKHKTQNLMNKIQNTNTNTKQILNQMLQQHLRLLNIKSNSPVILPCQWFFVSWDDFTRVHQSSYYQIATASVGSSDQISSRIWRSSSFSISSVNWQFIWKVVFCVHSVHSVQCSEILLFATFTVWNVHCV